MKQILLSILVIGSLLLTACGAATTVPTTEEETEPTPKEEAAPKKELQILKQWKGIGTKTTEPFVITESPWVISWAFNPEPILGIYANLLSVHIQKPNDALYFELPINIANVTQGTTGQSYVYDKGTFYLDIMSMSGKWHIVIYSYQ